MLGGLIIYAYQLSLNYGLEHYILNAPRVDIISQNKEGICSFAGYLAIFLISATFGSLIFNPHGLRNAVLMVTLFTLSCFAVFYSDTAVSRRIANAGYVIFVTTTCMWMIIMFDTVNLLAGRYWHVSFPQVLKSINRNQLFTFLIANVGTGAVNMNMDTLSQSDLNGFIIVAVYVMVVALTAIFLDIRLDSTIKI
ncbi:hypothetical protein HK098_007716 [Nowakowskiella sp. JEL0407]|nr:hypothetical protein HK098_007716 [Nowakowskiella sp. JEL0407]